MTFGVCGRPLHRLRRPPPCTGEDSPWHDPSMILPCEGGGRSRWRGPPRLAGPHDPLPRHRPQGWPVRAPQARRHGRRRPCSTTIRRRRQRPSRTRASNTCTSSISTAPSPASSVNGEAVQAILDAVSFPVQLGGGIRSIAHIEDWLGRGLKPASSSAPSRCAIRRWCARRRGCSPARSPSASMRAAARWRWKAGPRPPSSPPSSSASASRAQGSRRSSIPTSTATAC